MNRRLPSKKEWEKITEQAFKSGQQHVFSPEYQQRKKCIMEGTDMSKNSDFNKRQRRITETRTSKPIGRRIAGAAAVVAAAAVIVPAYNFTYDKIAANIDEETTEYIEETVPAATETETIPDETEETTESVAPLAYMESTDIYQNDVIITPPAGTEYLSSFYEIGFSFLPEGLVYNEDGPYAGKYKNDLGGGMTPVNYRVPQNGIHEKLKFSADFKQIELDDRTIMVNYRQGYDPESADPSNFGREIWVAFANEGYAVQLYVTDDISEEDVLSIAEGITLTPADSETAQFWTNREVSEGSGAHGGLYQLGVDADLDQIDFYHVGDTFRNDLFKEYDCEYRYCDITLDNAYITDNFDGLNIEYGRDQMIYDFIDENGKLLPVQRDWIVCGNGKNSLDEVIHSETVEKRLLVLELTYTNITDIESDICVNPDLYTSIDGTLYPTEIVPYEDADEIIDTPRLSFDRGNMFSFWCDSNCSKNNLILQPGESAHVELIFSIDADNVGNLYLSAQPINNGVTLDNFYDSPMVDLTDIPDC